MHGANSVHAYYDECKNRRKNFKFQLLPLARGESYVKVFSVTTLAEIEAAIDALPASETQLLLAYVAARLKVLGGTVPDALGRDQMRDWMAEDEAAMRRFRPHA